MMADIPNIQYSPDFKISFESLDYAIDTNRGLGLENYQSDSAAAGSMAPSPSSSDLIPALAPLEFGETDLPFGYDSKSVHSFDDDLVGSACLYPLTVNVVEIDENPSDDIDEEGDHERNGHEEDDHAEERAKEGHKEENPQDNNSSTGHQRRLRGSRGSRLACRLDLGIEIEVDGVKVYDIPQNNITGAKTLLGTLMVDVAYQTPTMQKAVAMLKAAAAQDAARDKSQLETTDATRRSAAIGGPTTNGKTDAIHLQETTVKTDIDVMIRTGARIMMKIVGIVAMMTTLALAIIVAHLHLPIDIEARWPEGFKPAPIEKYDGQTNPREWLQLHSTAIRSGGGDTFVMANYLPVCLDLAVRIWLTSLLEKSVTSWGELNRKLMESFQATWNRLGNHSDLTWIKQNSDEPLHDYIKQFYAKKTKILNVLDQQIIAAFQGGIRSDYLVRKIGQRNHDLKLTAREYFEIADKFAIGESALDDIRGKGNEKRSDKPESSKKDKKRKHDNMVTAGNHKTKDCYRQKGFTTAALKVAKDPPRRNGKDKAKDDYDKDEEGEFHESRK
ncbi:hypothetical protein PR202_ga12497 [Eleusine coracana subsp. coracana]|uniref:Retrotransposon gag domain-containing protein n=1 Tax=Eleusine coracana subsp. coracana TaxID=191504 RepID=A0AAV5CC79_ELECO|nr:hypothetical protein PR202_ga12497 [Eleusine coracana subsp. coracana]